MIDNAKILIVDDNNQNRQILNELITKIGHTAILAENGVKALDKLGGNKIDLILLDILMPVMDGYHTLEKIKECPQYKHIPVIMITTIDEMKSIVKCIEMGADDYLTKPFEPQILKARINNCLVKLELFKTEKELLEKTLTGSLKILIDILTIINSEVYGKANRVKRLVKYIAAKMKIADSWNLEIAAMLSQVGCIAVSSEILERITSDKNVSPNERLIYKKHPLIGYKLLNKLPRLEKVAQIIKYQNKNYDGTGIPEDNLRESLIPIESRILHVALDYDTFNNQGINPLKSLEKLREAKVNYDVTILDALEKIILDENKKEIKFVKVAHLDYGMIFAEDVVTTGNIKVIGKGQEVSYVMIKRLQNISKTQTIKEPIKVIHSKTWI